MELYFYIALVKYVSGCVLLRGCGFNTIKLSPESNCNHMYLQEFKTLYAFDNW